MSVSKSKRKATAVEDGKLEEMESIPESIKTIEDLPPEVLTIILEHVTLDRNRNKMLDYRLVNTQWKDIIDSIIEKEIVSGDFPVAPGLKIVGMGRQYEKLHIRFSETRFPVDQNPFPFKSLLLSGNRSAPDFNYDPELRHIPVKLPAFLSEFGGTLTSFTLEDQVIPITTLASMLNSMPSLKRLSLVDVKQVNAIIKPGTQLPTAPPLPSLTFLEVKSKPRNGPMDDKRIIMNLWLVASYADQLVTLNLETVEPFPPLRKGFEYSHIFEDGEKLMIASTTAAAFGKLKRLQIFRPTADFLRFSETTTLQRLTARGLTREDPTLVTDLNLIQFAVKCEATLETLCLDIKWAELGQDMLMFSKEDGVTLPMVKTLAIPYPYEEFYEELLSEQLLVMFPALEVLQLLRFRPGRLDNEMSLIRDEEEPQNVMIPLENEIEQAVDIVALKQRLASRRNRYIRIGQGGVRLVRLAMVVLPRGVPREEARNHVVVELPAENAAIEEMVRVAARSAMRNEMVRIFKRLIELGEKKEEVIVEQMIGRGGFWNGCANLKVISVNSGGEPGEDLCLVRRPNDS